MIPGLACPVILYELHKSGAAEHAAMITKVLPVKPHEYQLVNLVVFTDQVQPRSVLRVPYFKGLNEAALAEPCMAFCVAANA